MLKKRFQSVTVQVTVNDGFSLWTEWTSGGHGGINLGQKEILELPEPRGGASTAGLQTSCSE